MGLSSTTNRVSFTGDGSSTVFSFPYYFFNRTDLAVYLYDTGSSVVFPQTLSTNYTIAGNVNTQGVYPSGGQVVMNSAFPSNLQLIIARSPTPIQNYSLLQNSPINSLALTQQLDYLTALVQRLQDEVSRCVQLPDGLGTINATTFNTGLPSAVNLPANGNSALVLNSGATGFSLAVVLTQNGTTVTPVANGGTGQNQPLASGALIYAPSPTTMGSFPYGGIGQILLSQGAGVAPAWGPLQLNNNSSVLGILPFAFGGTGYGSSLPLVQNGSVAYFTGSSFQFLPPGTSGFFLASGSSAAPSWQAGLSNPMTTLGDIIYGAGGGVATRLAIGNSSQVLGSQGGSSAPLWITPYQNPLTTPGDVLFAGSGGVATRLAIGVTGQTFLVNSSGLPFWGPLSLSSGSSVVGVLPTQFGGTGSNITPVPSGLLYGSSNAFVQLSPGAAGTFLQSNGSSAPLWASTLSNPMTQLGDIIYAGSGGVVTRLAAGIPSSVLQTLGSSAAPQWAQIMGNSSVVKAPTYQRFTTPGSQTYTTPTNPSPIALVVEVLGGGGGGSGSGSSPGAGATGLATSFNSSAVVALGGVGATNTGVAGVGGTVTNSGAILIHSMAGNGGGYSVSAVFGGSGGDGFYGGGATPVGGIAGVAGVANSGSGGTGSGTGGGGGGAGGYGKVQVNNPTGTYNVIVAASSAPGVAGGAGLAGGFGQTGIVIVTELYN